MLRRRKPEAPWVRWSPSGESEDFLAGNREGFLQLRKAVDKLLESGEPCRMDDEDRFDFRGVMLLDAEPAPYQRTWRQRFLGLGCTFVVLTAIGFALYKLWLMFEAFQKL